MKLIEDLGIEKTGYIDKRYNTEATRRFGLFECPVCSAQIKLGINRGLKQTTCIDCRGTQNVSHGYSGTRQYFIWQQMVQRCINPKHKKYHIYGGKGITIDPKWESFEGFWEDMETGYESNLTIDRIDSSKGYTKDNCRWITKEQNSSETTKRRPVIQLMKDPNNVKEWIEVKRWNSALEAANATNAIASHIGAVCSGKRKTHNGFKWQYAN